MRLRLLLALVAFVAAPAAWAQSTPRSSDAWWHMRQGATDRETRRDLLSLFEPVEPIRRGMFTQHRGAFLVTKAHGTGYRGLCRRDTLFLSYASIEEGGGSAALLAPYGFTAGQEFLITAPPVPRDSPGIWDAACEAIRRDDARWLRAADEGMAVAGYQALSAILARVEGDVLPTTFCPDLADKALCAETIRKGFPEKSFFSVEPCDAPRGKHCLLIGGNMSQVRVTFSETSAPIEPKDLERVEAEEIIIVT